MARTSSCRVFAVLSVLCALCQPVLHGQTIRVDSTYDRFSNKTTVVLTSDWVPTTNPRVEVAFYYRASPPCSNMGSEAVPYSYCGANLIMFRYRAPNATTQGVQFGDGCIEYLIDEERNMICGSGGIGVIRRAGRDSSGRFVSIRSASIGEGNTWLSQVLATYQSAEFRIITVEWSLTRGAMQTYRKWAAEVEARERRFKPWLFDGLAAGDSVRTLN
jgi:hypothetical protein